MKLTGTFASSSSEKPTARGRVLLVDDDAAVLRAHARGLERSGYDVVTATSGASALDAMESATFDVVLSDLDMPDTNGLKLLEFIRARDLDVPILFITGAPSLDTAVEALERGALRYLIKPVGLRALVDATDDAVRLYRIAQAKRRALDLAGGVDRLVGDRAGLVASFTRTLETLNVAYQPIVSLGGKSIFAYEALLRSREPSLPHPGAVLDAAEKLGRVHELGRRIRSQAVAPMGDAGDALLFLNLHPLDLLDDQLLLSEGPLAKMADRVVLEITERASLHGLGDVRGRVAKLRERGYRIALDDLGAGYAGLTSFALLEPNVVKLDMALVRDIHREPTKQAVVRTMITMCRELEITVVAEGIETAEERDELLRAGCDLMQGYLFARPGDPFPAPNL